MKTKKKKKMKALIQTIISLVELGKRWIDDSVRIWLVSDLFSFVDDFSSFLLYCSWNRISKDHIKFESNLNQLLFEFNANVSLFKTHM